MNQSHANGRSAPKSGGRRREEPAAIDVSTDLGYDKGGSRRNKAEDNRWDGNNEKMKPLKPSKVSSYLRGEKRKESRSDEAALGPFVCPSATVYILESTSEPFKKLSRRQSSKSNTDLLPCTKLDIKKYILSLMYIMSIFVFFIYCLVPRPTHST